MKPKLEEIHGELPGMEVYAMMGNDDWLKLLHNKKYRLGNGFEI